MCHSSTRSGQFDLDGLVSVSTFDSMAPYRILIVCGMVGRGDGAAPASRTDFLDTSAWLPVIEMDENEQAAVTINLPDNTTS